ncbi:uncharacterized protein TNCV_3439891 [Trichonephila clavipes]|nr:uncharacterized protein TNCV_3439891 [Trichonephila clavipes]
MSRRAVCKFPESSVLNFKSKHLKKVVLSVRQAELLHLPFSDVEPHSLKFCLSPAKRISKVHFHFDLSTPVVKGDLILDHLRLLALDIIDGIPNYGIKIDTDGSRLSDRAGSGIYIEKRRERSSFCHRNPNFSSVFKSELIAIEHGLEAVFLMNKTSETSGSSLIVAVLFNISITGSQSEIKLASPYFKNLHKYQSPMMLISSGFHPMLTSLETNKRISWRKRVVMLLHLSLQPSPTLNTNLGLNLKF